MEMPKWKTIVWWRGKGER